MPITTVPTNDRREYFVASGGQTVFPFDFPVYAATDLAVYRQRSGVQTTLVNGADYTVTGAGDQAGGAITLTFPALAGDAISIVSAQPVARSTSFTDGGDLPASALNAEYNRLIIALQQVTSDARRTIRLPESDPPEGLPLPGASERANRLLFFDSAGEIALIATPIGGSLSDVVAAGSTTVRTLAERFAERVNVRDFGAVGNGAANDAPAINAAALHAATTGRVLWFPAGDYRTTAAVTLPSGARGIVMDGEIVATGGFVALTCGDGGAVNNQGKLYGPIRVRRATQSDWSSEADIGVVIQNANASLIEIARAEGFTIGVRTQGDGRGFEDSTVVLGRIVDNKIGVDVRTLQAGAWNNAVRYIGGHFACASGTNPTLDRFGVRFSRETGAYNLHNGHTFIGPNFELQRQGTPGTVAAIPFLLEVNGRGLRAIGVRMEACSPFVARHTVDFNDATYEVEYVGTYGFTGAAIDYPGTATRAGGTSIARHQAAAVHAAPRLLAAVPNVRAVAYRDVTAAAGGVGFEGLAVLSGNPAGPPTTLNGFAFPGLNLMTLNAEDVTLPTSRALAFIVDSSRCKEFVLAAEGDELRPVVMQFDASENVLTDTSRVLLSNMNVTWPGTAATWWEGVADLDGLTGGIALNRHQRVTLHANAAFAAIGVRGGSASAKVKAMRLYCDPLHAPRVLAGGSRSWGTREVFASHTWDPPSISAGNTYQDDFAVTGARAGDVAQAGFTTTTVLPLDAWVAASNTVRARFFNNTGAPVDLAAGTLHLTVRRPRL